MAPGGDAAISVQAGAFRSLDGALSLGERLRGAGFDPRVVTVPGDPLIRVRLGRFQLREGAEGLKRELERAGFEAAVVLDALSEERIR
jgi:cell division protein FtsN